MPKDISSDCVRVEGNVLCLTTLESDHASQTNWILWDKCASLRDRWIFLHIRKFNWHQKTLGNHTLWTRIFQLLFSHTSCSYFPAMKITYLTRAEFCDPLKSGESSSPLSRRRQFLHFLLLHLVVHLGSFVKQALQVAIGSLKGSIRLDTSTDKIQYWDSYLIGLSFSS